MNCNSLPSECAAAAEKGYKQYYFKQSGSHKLDVKKADEIKPAAANVELKHDCGKRKQAPLMLAKATKDTSSPARQCAAVERAASDPRHTMAVTWQRAVAAARESCDIPAPLQHPSGMELRVDVVETNYKLYCETCGAGGAQAGHTTDDAQAGNTAHGEDKAEPPLKKLRLDINTRLRI